MYEDPKAYLKHKVNLSKVLVKMNVDEEPLSDEDPDFRRKVDFFYLPYRKDMTISKGLPLSNDLSKK